MHIFTFSFILGLFPQGMKLGGASKSKNMLDSLIKEDHLVTVPTAKKASTGGGDAAVPAAVVAASVHPVTLSVEERLSCQVTPLMFSCTGIFFTANILADISTKSRSLDAVAAILSRRTRYAGVSCVML